MKKIFLSIFVVFLSVAGIFGGGFLFSGSAQTGPEDVSTSAIFSGGSGTASDPYLVSTVADLVNVVQASHTNKYFKQINDIDISKSTIINAPRAVFNQSTYDGQNFSIIGLTINTYLDGAGAFRYCLDSTLKNIVLEDVKIDITSVRSADDPLGSGVDTLAIGALCATASNCVISQCAVVSGYVSENFFHSNIVYKYMGGLIGQSAQNTIVECFSKANVIGGLIASTGCSYAGGLIGGNPTTSKSMGRPNDTILNCYYVGLIQTGYNYAGGLMGSNVNSYVSKCYVANYYEPNSLALSSLNNYYFWILGLKGGGLIGYLSNRMDEALCTDILIFSPTPLLAYEDDSYKSYIAGVAYWLVGDYNKINACPYLLGYFINITPRGNAPGIEIIQTKKTYYTNSSYVVAQDAFTSANYLAFDIDR